MKIIGFAQLHNELQKGNLKNWFKSMSFCDYIYIYDQASTDGSDEYYKKFLNTRVIYSKTNDFKNEIQCKKILLETILNENDEFDYIFWLDGDSIFDWRLLNSRKNLDEILNFGLKHEEIDGFCTGHYNLWRNDIWYRVDNEYHSLNNLVIPFWKNKKGIKFDILDGLHQSQVPSTIKTICQIPFAIIHRGFATDYQIMLKYDIYKERGQKGWDLDRLLDEKTLTVEKIPYEIIPDWFILKDVEDPKNKRKIIDIYNEKEH